MKEKFYPENETRKLNLREAEKQVKEWIETQLSNFMLSPNANVPEKLGHFSLSIDEQELLNKIKVLVESEKARATTSRVLSIREIVFSNLGLTELDRYDSTMTKAKSVSMHAELFNILPEHARAAFPKAQERANQMFSKIIKGAEFKGLVLSHEEIEMISSIRDFADTNIKDKRTVRLTEIFTERQKIIYENLIQRISFRIIDETIETEEIASIEAVPGFVSTAANEKAKGWQEVIRISDQEAIGDLNGSFESFIAHLSARGLIEISKDQIQWRGGNKKVVFVGDILGDRNSSGLKTIEAIDELNNQAQKQGGSVESLAGNHDNMFTAVLAGFSLEHHPAEKTDTIFAYAGTLESSFYAGEEFKKYVVSVFKNGYNAKKFELEEDRARKEKTVTLMMTLPRTNPEHLEIFKRGIMDIEKEIAELDDLFSQATPDDEERFFSLLKYIEYKYLKVIGNALCEGRSTIIENMRSNIKGKKRLEAICNQKLATFHDDTLYVHTNFTHEMLIELTKNEPIEEAVKRINFLYRKGLRYYLLKEGDLSEEESKQFDALRLLFLNTSEKNRINFTEDTRLSEKEKRQVESELKTKGVNLIIHGHNDESDRMLGTAELPIISIDRSVFKFDESRGRNLPISTVTIDTKGNVLSKEANQVIRKK